MKENEDIVKNILNEEYIPDNQETLNNQSVKYTKMNTYLGLIPTFVSCETY